MATQQLQLICDQSTYANFFQWASAISSWFATCGWAQSTDTGQEMWTGLSISAVGSISGSNATYTYSSLTGLPLQIGRALTITACTHSINNGTFIITAFTGTTSGTFTITNQNGTPLSESGSSGVVTAASTVPGSAAYVYDIWTPNDTLTTFYLKVQYGNYASTNEPNIALTLGASSNGSGTITGYSTGVVSCCTDTGITPPSTTVGYECDFSGAAGRVAVMMWRNGGNNCPQFFAVERSLNSSGAYTGAYATVLTAGPSGDVSQYNPFQQSSVVFGVGTPPTSVGYTGADYGGGWFVRNLRTGGSTNFNNGIAMDLVAPLAASGGTGSGVYFDYPMTVAGVGFISDFVEGLTFQVTVYGATRTYMPSKHGYFSYAGLAYANQWGALLMRFD